MAVTLGLVACVIEPPEGEQAGEYSSESAAAQAAGDTLTALRIEAEGEGTLVVLEGLSDPVYTAYMSSDPKVLVVDLAGVKIESGLEPVAVYDGLVEQVSIADFDADGGSARLEIALARDAEFDVKPGDGGLSVSMTPIGALALDASDEDAAASAEDPWVAPSGSVVIDDETLADLALPATDPTVDALADFTPPMATKIQDLAVQTLEGGVLFHLIADGTIGMTESFTLEDPDRLVIDLPGLASATARNRYDVDASSVSGVRIGAHADKVRLVLDGGADSKGFEGRNLWPATDGLLLSVGSGPALDEALAQAITRSDDLARSLAAAAAKPDTVALALDQAEAEIELVEDAIDFESVSDESIVEDAIVQEEIVEEEVAEISEGTAPVVVQTIEPSAEESAWLAEPVVSEASVIAAKAPTTQVYGVHYDSQETLDRVAVLADGMLDFEMLYPDNETAVLSLPHAKVAPGATGRVPVEGGPISLLSVFQQPDVAVAEVRVVMKRAPGLVPSVTRRGSMLFLDWERSGRMAAAPPAFEGDASPMTAADKMASLDAPRGAAQQALAGESSIGTIEAEEIVLQDAPIESLAMPAASDEGIAFGGESSLDGPLSAPQAAAPASLEPPAAVELLEEGGLLQGKEYVGRRLSLDFKDVEIADILRLIAEVSDLNLITGDEVSGQITIRLVDVPWDQALDVILLTKGLGFVRVGNVLRIAPDDILKAEEEVRLQERRNKEKLVDLQVKLMPVNYADVQDMAKLVTRLLTSRGTVNTDERTNTLIIKDIPSVIDESTALVKAVDTQTPQVMIEAKIVEANLDFSRELGSEWSLATNPFEDGFGGTAPNRGLGGPDFRFHDENSISFSNPITATPTGALSLGAFLLNDDLNLEVKLAAAESSGDGKVISSPRVVTLDNKEAEIEQGVSIPFQTFEGGDAKLEFIDAVLSLKVTPHITADKSIIMSIEVTRNAPDDTVATPTGSPAISKAEAKTETLVKDGQTLVLGGIYTITKSQRESRVPYLHRIPILGNAFKSREITDSKKELLIFVTPRIVLSEMASN